jgi:hypothetical protein
MYEDDTPHIAAETLRMLRLSEDSERLKAKSDRLRNNAALLLMCTLINAGFLVFDVVRHDPGVAVGVEALITTVCFGAGFGFWMDYRRAREQYRAAHASYMLALRGGR